MPYSVGLQPMSRRVMLCGLWRHLLSIYKQQLHSNTIAFC